MKEPSCESVERRCELAAKTWQSLARCGADWRQAQRGEVWQLGRVVQPQEPWIQLTPPSQKFWAGEVMWSEPRGPHLQPPLQGQGSDPPRFRHLTPNRDTLTSLISSTDVG